MRMLYFSIGCVIYFTIRIAASIKFKTEPICLRSSNETASPLYNKIICEHKSTVLFITQVQYTNDYLGECAKSPEERSNVVKLNKNNRCFAYPSEDWANMCNGRTECVVNLNQPDFRYGFSGSNCNFRAKILSISYECIPNAFNDVTVPKFNICPDKRIEYAIHGFIHSPNYPNDYESRKYCQTTIKINEATERIEIFLIDMELESVSKRTYTPTDFLQINNKEMLFGEKNYQLIYNDTKDAIITFKTDLLFNKRGFLLYFQTQKKVDEIEIEEDIDREDYAVNNGTLNTTTLTTTSTTTTMTTDTNTSKLLYSTSTWFLTSNYSILQNDTNTTIENWLVNNENINSLNITDSPTGFSNQYTLSKPIINSQKSVRNLDSLTENIENSFTFKTILTLISIILFLSSIILFLIVKNRKGKFLKSALYKGPFYPNRTSELRFYDQSVVNGYLDTSIGLNHLPNSSANYILTGAGLQQSADGYIHRNSIIISHPVNLTQPILDDSKTRLLNNLTNSYIEPVRLSKVFLAPFNQVTINPNQVYDDVKDTNTIEHCKLDKSLNSKVNDYCYIPANGLPNPVKSEPQEVKRDEKTSAARSDSKQDRACCSSWLTDSSSESPESERSNKIMVTSTPSVPKTLPPTLSLGICSGSSDETETDYDVPDRISKPSEYKSMLDETIKTRVSFVCEDERDTSERDQKTIVNKVETKSSPLKQSDHQSEYDYQVPSNLNCAE